MKPKVKVVAVHSNKGGVGKTTVALLLAKHAATNGHRTCVLDFDFIGAGMADLLAFDAKPTQYLEGFYNSIEPHAFELGQLLVGYTDKQVRPKELSFALSFGSASASTREVRKWKNLEEGMSGRVANEHHYREIQMKTSVLLDKLADEGFDMVVIDLHPGLFFVSETIRSLASVNVYVTTPHRGDCLGLLGAVSRMKLDTPRSFLVINTVPEDMHGLAGFRGLMKSDTLTPPAVKTLLSRSGLRYLGKREEQCAFIPDSKVLRKLFYLGSSGILPKMDPKQPVFRCCDKILETV